jgi:hypothetical protein
MVSVKDCNYNYLHSLPSPLPFFTKYKKQSSITV